MADPDLQIREGPGHPDPKIRRGRRSPKHFSRPFEPQFSLTIRGGRWGGGNPPLDTQYMHNFKTGSTKGTNGN